MNFLFYLFDITPFVIIICTLIIIISLFLKNETCPIVFLMFLLAYVGVLFVVLPFAFLLTMFENLSDIMFMVGIIVTVWFIISVYIYIRNIYIIRKNKIKEIYIRDADVDYSPAVLSYLINNKVETRKDLPATLLNLCAKSILKIQKNEDGKINIIDLKNTKEVSRLKPDEKYAYKMLLEGISTSKIDSWKNKVQDEYAKYKFSIKHKRPLVIYLISLFVIILVAVLLHMAITGKSEITGRPAEIIAQTMLSPFFGAWVIMSISGIKSILRIIITKNNNYNHNFKDTYTKKGAKEYSRWKSFERFMEDFSVIDEKEHESVIIWGKYLSYSIALGINKKCDNELYTKIKSVYSFNYDVISNMLENEEK